MNSSTQNHLKKRTPNKKQLIEKMRYVTGERRGKEEEMTACFYNREQIVSQDY